MASVIIPPCSRNWLVPMLLLLLVQLEVVNGRWGRNFFRKLRKKDLQDSDGGGDGSLPCGASTCASCTCCSGGDDSNAPSIVKDGKAVRLDSFPTVVERGLNVSVVDADKQLFYIHAFLSAAEAEAMSSFCAEPGRFQRSPQTGVADASGAENLARTSSSCPLLFAIFYMPRFADVQAKNPALAKELELTWNVTVRAAGLLGVDPANLEPFQLLRYSPGEYYKQHHDHRAYYEPGPAGYPDRPVTLLLFLNDVPVGGQLKFDRLGLEFSPRRGDAVAWSNVRQDTGKADPDMVHEAMPLPEGATKMAVNVWVRDEPFTSPQQAMQRQQSR
jgi:hypothetical protein